MSKNIERTLSPSRRWDVLKHDDDWRGRSEHILNAYLATNDFTRTLYAAQPETPPLTDWEPGPDEEYNASEFGALYNCTDMGHMEAGEIVEEDVTVTGPDGIPRQEKRYNKPHLEAVQADLNSIILQAGFTPVRSNIDFYMKPSKEGYAKAGYTCKISLAQSAFEINTWPKPDGKSYVDFNIHVCCKNTEGLQYDKGFPILYGLLKEYYGAPREAVTAGVRKLPIEDPRGEPTA